MAQYRYGDADTTTEKLKKPPLNAANRLYNCCRASHAGCNAWVRVGWQVERETQKIVGSARKCLSTIGYYSVRSRQKKYPSPEELTTYILSGHTTRDAMERYAFSTLNISHLQIYYAFKRLKIARPRYNCVKRCKSCGLEFNATKISHVFCSRRECRSSRAKAWTHNRYLCYKMQNLSPYVRQWTFATIIIQVGLLKLDSLSVKGKWDTRILYLQSIFTLRHKSSRKISERTSARYVNWSCCFFKLQTGIYIAVCNFTASKWEVLATRIIKAIRAQNHEKRQ